MSRALRIDLFADIVCPWCLIGVARLDKAIAALPPDVVVDIEHHPFYLDPDAPPEGYEVADMLRRKYGRDPREIWAPAEAEARKSGIELDLSKQPRVMPTRKAHTLIRLARPRGTQHALARALFDAYFIDHRPVADDDVLADVATRHGFSRDEALAALTDRNELAITHRLAEDAMGLGIRGVPFFVFGNRLAFSGAQPQDVFSLALGEALGEDDMPSLGGSAPL